MVRASRIVRGGGRRFFYPRTMWSPAGGYWNDVPPGSEGRGWMLYAAAAVAIFSVARYSSSHEVRLPGRSGRCGRACAPSGRPPSQRLRNPDGAEPLPSGLFRASGREERS